MIAGEERVVEAVRADFFETLRAALSSAKVNLIDSFNVDQAIREMAVNAGVPCEALRYPAPWERELRAKRRRAALLGWRRRRGES